MDLFEKKFVYIFQASRSILFDVDEFSNGIETIWGVDDNLPSRQLRKGDRVLIKSVKHEGIVGYGEISRSWYRLPKPLDLGRVRKSKFAVKIAYLGKFDPVLTTTEMQADKILRQMRIMKFHQGTFFPVGTEAKKRLQQILSQRT